MVSIIPMNRSEKFKEAHNVLVIVIFVNGYRDAVCVVTVILMESGINLLFRHTYWFILLKLFNSAFNRDSVSAFTIGSISRFG